MGVTCRLVDLPLGVKGITILGDAGDYSIYLNARHSWDTLRQAYAHELAHIRLDHLYDDKPLALCELAADAEPEPAI